MKRRCEWNDFFAGIHKFLFLLIIIAFLVVSFSNPQRLFTTGTMTDLGTLGGSYSVATDGF